MSCSRSSCVCVSIPLCSTPAELGVNPHHPQQEVRHQLAVMALWHPPSLCQVTLTAPYRAALFLAHVHEAELLLVSEPRRSSVKLN